MSNTWEVRPNETKLYVNIKLFYPQGNTQLCSIGHIHFHFYGQESFAG